MIAVAGDGRQGEPPGRLDRLADRERLLRGFQRGPRLVEELAPGVRQLDARGTRTSSATASSSSRCWSCRESAG